MAKRLEIITNSKEETQRIGAFLAPLFNAGDVVLLEGDLGAGKTTFTGGVASGLHIDEPVISPTFNILKCYFHGDLPLYHIDAYRLENQNIELGLEEFIEGNGLTLIEWPQYIAPLLPDAYLKISFYHQDGDKRRLVFESNDAHGDALIAKVEASL